MTIWIITICYFLTMILLVFYLFITNQTKKDILKNWEETNGLNHELIETNNKLLNTNVRLIDSNKKLIRYNDELIEKLHKKCIIEVYLLMTLSETKEDYNKFTKCYQKLYSFGISKEILDDEKKLQDFISKIVDNKIIISTGKEPFEYVFHEKN